ncbi:hypothetical protein [uncultured Methanobrevibacter sp.]|uniref:hypothetical protein n=1 Tax=uncultured Methanobrevibacter sp. TaxID=253161 RepID=UPI0025DB4531|nr:hypothetical protein [uncultured Methanobrevibacter sp.]
MAPIVLTLPLMLNRTLGMEWKCDAFDLIDSNIKHFHKMPAANNHVEYISFEFIFQNN